MGTNNVLSSWRWVFHSGHVAGFICVRNITGSIHVGVWGIVVRAKRRYCTYVHRHRVRASQTATAVYFHRRLVHVGLWLEYRDHVPTSVDRDDNTVSGGDVRRIGHDKLFTV